MRKTKRAKNKTVNIPKYKVILAKLSIILGLHHSTRETRG
jgi:hypothetical protein